MIRVFLLDDHILIREGIKKVLSDCPDIGVAAEAENAEDLFSYLEKKSVDILVLDITLPDRSGLDIIGEITQRYPRVKILVLSMHPEDRYALRAFHAGASGYLSKESAADEIINAIRKIAAGGRYVSQLLGERLAGDLGTGSCMAPHERLSGREFQVFLLVARGKSTNEIAAELRIRVSTVSTYRSRIVEKMNVSSSADIVRYALHHSLIE